MKIHSSKGIGLVEVIIGSAIILGIVSVLALVNTTYIHLSSNNLQEIKGQFLLEEGVEAVKTIRDRGWTTNIISLSATSTYYLSFNSSLGQWTATTTPVYVGTFVRSFVLPSVHRDSNDDIVATGTVDPGTRRLNVSVSWRNSSGTTTETLSTYLTNLYND